ncbi:hypothetical protein ACM1TL_05450 [Lysinibacillus capsici]|uniref:AbiU2 domain-containing protein n=1 Tax=Lysinibacillus TaxID=400634 RepID=UPI003665BDB6
MKQEVIGRFEKELSFLINQLYEINSYKLLHKHLYTKKNDPLFLSAMNKAPAFFGLTIHSYQHMFIVGLSKLCEERNSNGTNIYSFLNYIEKNHPLIFPNCSNKEKQYTPEKTMDVSPKMYETEMDLILNIPKTKIDVALIKEHRTQLNEYTDCINNLLAWRDKSFAHYDKEYIGESIEKMGEKYRIKYGDLSELISLIGKILNSYQSAYYDSTTSIIPANTYDVDNVLQALLHQQ